ncbi:hypothetical protein DFH07DRAFT_785652 [Mycena maculata]|uniref:Uncharacterized protein n=1 Tax=Mycena maculata TaxID=230809 RepID=A0AAD7H8S1_9AGAR|nr:hypothetical protein DFH07DRAFT_785652 [Mycena maculata]
MVGIGIKYPTTEIAVNDVLGMKKLQSNGDFMHLNRDTFPIWSTFARHDGAFLHPRRDHAKKYRKTLNLPQGRAEHSHDLGFTPTVWFTTGSIRDDFVSSQSTNIEFEKHPGELPVAECGRGEVEGVHKRCGGPARTFCGLTISVFLPTPDRVFDGAIATKPLLLFCVPAFLELFGVGLLQHVWPTVGLAPLIREQILWAAHGAPGSVVRKSISSAGHRCTRASCSSGGVQPRKWQCEVRQLRHPLKRKRVNGQGAERIGDAAGPGREYREAAQLGENARCGGREADEVRCGDRESLKERTKLLPSAACQTVEISRASGLNCAGNYANIQVGTPKMPTRTGREAERCEAPNFALPSTIDGSTLDFDVLLIQEIGIEKDDASERKKVDMKNERSKRDESGLMRDMHEELPGDRRRAHSPRRLEVLALQPLL